MIDFTHIKYGVILSLIAILFGGLLGLSFGCCEDSIKGSLRSSAQAVIEKHYEGDPGKAVTTVKKSWVYLKRAHLHSQTMGIIAIVFALVASGLRFPAKYQLGISVLSGLGSLGYGTFWFLAALLAPGMGSTHAAKESVALIAQGSGGAFFISGVGMFVMIVMRVLKKNEPTGEPGNTNP